MFSRGKQVQAKNAARIAVVGRRRADDDLLQGDGELVRVERAAFADLFARERHSQTATGRASSHTSCDNRVRAGTTSGGPGAAKQSAST